MNAVRSYTVILKYQRFTSSGRKDIRIRKFDFAAKSQFLRGEEKTKITEGILVSKNLECTNNFLR